MKESDPVPTISIDLGQLASIRGVATQGGKPGKVTKYKIRYSYDGRIWYGFPSNTSLMVRIFMVFVPPFQLLYFHNNQNR